jgi:5,10-methylene-tetrahydrofolate dehydrogenase/methenyl tetrahydrofolate cyclohydrolase
MANVLLGKNVTDEMKEKMQADIKALNAKGVEPKLAISKTWRKRRRSCL